MKTVTIVGKGNVAEHYFLRMSEKGLNVKMISSRQTFRSEDFASELIILAVKDDALEQLTLNILHDLKAPLSNNQILVHTSGFKETSFLQSLCSYYGSFYPLQTLKKGMQIDFNSVPLCTWANTEKAAEKLKNLAEKLSSIHYTLTDAQRQTLHLAAVFVNNFPNHLFHIADKILSRNDLSLSILFPLIDRTAEAIKNKQPFYCQTGPALRGEKSIMEQHKERLNPEEKAIYELISKDIMREHNV
ncbi:MAG: DUF2520 domain-containing protein [Bacteroidales bacterium]|nr:DUF2520 domain-containing protein [Bacteroidales bacterium]